MKSADEMFQADPEYAEAHARSVAVGRQTAAELSVCVVSIARNAMPYLTNTLWLVEKLREGFGDLRWYVYENDSTDGTNTVLDDFAAGHPWFHVRHDTLGGADERGFQPERTIRLAKCRNECHDFVRRHAADTTHTIVLDVDPHRGFSVDGVFSSLYWLSRLSGTAHTRRAGAMASYSIWSRPAEDDRRSLAHYDAWAARPPSWWRDRRDEIGFGWFSMFLPPVGSPPFPMNSAFGGLCVYLTEAFLSAGRDPYEGGDCEHVFLHRKMHAAGWQLYCNPGCIYVAHWIE